MRLDEILATPLFEMSYSKRKAETIINGLEKPINEHLLKIVCVGGTEVAHWRDELVNWLDEVAEIRLKPHDHPGQVKWYYDLLFDEPFGGVEERNVGGRIRRLVRSGYRVPPELEINAVVEILRRFHERFATACATGSLTESEIIALVQEIPTQ